MMKCFNCSKIIKNGDEVYEDDNMDLYCCADCFVETNCKSLTYEGDE